MVILKKIAGSSQGTRILDLLVLLCVIGLVSSCFFGSTSIPVTRVAQAMVGAGTIGDEIVIWEIRLARAFAALLVGGALGGSGAALQGLLRNPLAEPGVLGISAMSALGATTAIYFGVASITPAVVPIASILGAVTATSFILIVAIRVRSIVTLILVGAGISSLAGALISLLMNFSPNPFTLSDLISWMLGSVANRSYTDLLISGPLILFGLLTLWIVRHSLSVLSLGEDAAHALGLDIKKSRFYVIIGASVATGASVAIAGAVGFVGLVAPHIIRPLVGYDPARTIIPSALLGGLLVLIADLAIRLTPTATELRLGVVCALLGAPAFIWIAVNRVRADA